MIIFMKSRKQQRPRGKKGVGLAGFKPVPARIMKQRLIKSLKEELRMQSNISLPRLARNLSIGWMDVKKLYAEVGLKWPERFEETLASTRKRLGKKNKKIKQN